LLAYVTVISVLNSLAGPGTKEEDMTGMRLEEQLNRNKGQGTKRIGVLQQKRNKEKPNRRETKESRGGEAVAVMCKLQNLRNAGEMEGV
jgi:hypothetical protein